MRSIPILRRLDNRAKIRLKEAFPPWATRRLRPNMIRRSKRLSGRTHGVGVPLYGLVAAWHESDIIYASVRNAFNLGAEKVFLLDNGSGDDTIAEAVAAGATHVLTFMTDGYDEPLRIRFMNDYLQHLSERSGHERIWWLLMDADEFVHTIDGAPLTDLLADVDVSCRVIGARVLDHYPLPGGVYVPRTDPLASQPNCREKVDHRCLAGHHKHPIFLWHRHLPAIEIEPGFHQLRCEGAALYESTESVVLHHFPFRNAEVSRERLQLLARRGYTEGTTAAAAHAHIAARLASIEAVYEGRYDEVVDYRTGRPGITVEPWTEVLAD
jgi:hypothetical protein